MPQDPLPQHSYLHTRSHLFVVYPADLPDQCKTASSTPVVNYCITYIHAYMYTYDITRNHTKM